MMKKVKGFTLVECIVAMALIGIASLFMAQIYSSVAIISKNNKNLSTSLIEEMALAERKATSNGDNVKIIKLKSYEGSVQPDALKVGLSGDSEFNTKISATSKFKISGDVDYDLYIYKVDTSANSGRTKTVNGKSYGMDDSVYYKLILPKT